METLVLYADDLIAPRATNVSRVPREFNNNKQIKGVYLYVVESLRRKDWEEVAKAFCKERLQKVLEGKGSARAACRMIQNGHWGEFVDWTKHKYRS